MIFGWIFSSEMALLVIFRPIFRGFCSATLKWFEITSPDLLSNLSLIIGEVHEKNLRSGREQRCCGPSKFACRRFLPPLTLTLQRLQIITFFIIEIMTWDFCRPKIQHCMPPTVYIWWPWGNGFSAPHTPKVGILLKIVFFSVFSPLRRERSHLSNSKHLFDV